MWLRLSEPQSSKRGYHSPPFYQAVDRFTCCYAYMTLDISLPDFNPPFIFSILFRSDVRILFKTDAWLACAISCDIPFSMIEVRIISITLQLTGKFRVIFQFYVNQQNDVKTAYRITNSITGNPSSCIRVKLRSKQQACATTSPAAWIPNREQSLCRWITSRTQIYADKVF